MNDVLEHILAVFFGYMAIMNPLANTAVFVGLTADLQARTRLRVALRALLLTFVIILVFAALGKTIFHFFGISLPAFRITGGILVFLIGYHMLHGSGSSLHSGEPHASGSEDADDSNDQAADPAAANAEAIAISPLAVPILAGPGTIATTISYSASGSWMDISLTVAVFTVLCGITLICFLLGPKLLQLIGPNGLQIVTRLMGLILAVIGVQMFIEGLAGAQKLYFS